MTILNVGYELSDACTSIIARTPSGKVYHGRNMDFWDGIFFTGALKNLTAQVNWQKGGKTVLVSTQFVGYAGILSGMSPEVFSVTIDSRFYPEGLSQLFYEAIYAIETKNATLVSFLTRDALLGCTNFSSAVDMLSNRKNYC